MKTNRDPRIDTSIAHAATFARLTPSHRREYIAWVSGAKREETRARRLATTIQWLGEGSP